MKVFELMYELNQMPAGAEVRFHSIEKKDDMIEYSDDEAMFEIDYAIKDVELIENLTNSDDIVQLGNF